MNDIRRLSLLFTIVWCCFYSYAQIDQEAVKNFAEDYSKTHDVPLEKITSVLSNAVFQESIIEKMKRPYENTMTWDRYRNIFLKKDRIEAGVNFWRGCESILQEVSESTGVPEEVIIGILGVETYFGQRIGAYRVLDALYTLAFGYPSRAAFFKLELKRFLEVVEQEQLDVFEIMGSYAGAIGYCQFMPSSYLAYASSYDEDGPKNLMEPEDAIASVANYLKSHRWRKDEPVVHPVVRLEDPLPLKSNVKPSNPLSYYFNRGYIPEGGPPLSIETALVKLENEKDDEYWFGFYNFYVITRYNHSRLYAMAVYQLGEAVKERMGQP